MKAATMDMFNWIKAYNADIAYIALYFVSILYLFVARKDLRKRVVIPSFVVLVLLVNPILYRYIYSKIVYWRFFWILMDGMIVSCAITDIVKRINKKWMKTMVSLLFAAVIVFVGNNIFKSDVFVKAQNWQKLSKETQNIANVMLNMETNPSCIAPLELSYELRQYSGDIEMMYGRNSNGFINRLDEACVKVRQEIDLTYDYNYVFLMAGIHGYQFVICHANMPVDGALLETYGYGAVYADEEYVLYYNETPQEYVKDKALVLQYTLENTTEEDDVQFYVIDTVDNTVLVTPQDIEDIGLIQSIFRSHNNKVNDWYMWEEGYLVYDTIINDPQGAGMENVVIGEYRDIDLEELFEGDSDRLVRYEVIEK